MNTSKRPRSYRACSVGCLKGSFKGDRDLDTDVEVDVDIESYFGCLKGFQRQFRYCWMVEKQLW